MKYFITYTDETTETSKTATVLASNIDLALVEFQTLIQKQYDIVEAETVE
jgi:hypothetical protein